MIRLKDKAQIEKLRICGGHLADLLDVLAKATVPGVTTGALDRMAQEYIKKVGCTSALMGYRPYGAKRPYPAATCISINNEVVHGIPSDSRTINDGDVVTLDATIAYQGMITDAAVTVAVGEVSAEAKRLIEATRGALKPGIAAAQSGGYIGDIGYAIDTYVTKQGFHTIPTLAGHGVGFEVHEDPYVPNQGERGQGDMMIPGMVLAIEPIVAVSTDDVRLLKDGYTFVTKDGSLAAHFEHTVLITENGPEILTKRR
jgi:methionyl aminopeptidase